MTGRHSAEKLLAWGKSIDFIYRPSNVFSILQGRSGLAQDIGLRRYISGSCLGVFVVDAVAFPTLVFGHDLFGLNPRRGGRRRRSLAALLLVIPAVGGSGVVVKLRLGLVHEPILVFEPVHISFMRRA
ncbi:hypothetical protein CMUS01_10988 [Colletotrichum musicola]|uniref:Uncharacterized protein n=1 Tax=Colletotrichum musicola TaxID=2175873 RepID=A0A8H6K0J3_9PEZI|nr:hypothetical protein CMUS01_10988 [Colletotrichum musicola]